MTSVRETLWASGYDETVEVNQRALIDKVLARYSGEFTVFRELLQNSDDASSSAVEIHFDTQAYLDRDLASTQNGEARSSTTSGVSMNDVSGSVGANEQPKKVPDLKVTHVHQWTFKNNGITFRDEDWNRLKKIAEGNPDEEKIGAFGVGFYSLFSITEEPFVTSGDEWMGFYWKDKKDQLFARRGTLPPSGTDSINTPSHNSWTSFALPLRTPAPIPPALDFIRFLATSLTFTVHLRSVSVFFNGLPLARLSKDPGLPKQLPLPQSLKTESPFGYMKVNKISSKPLHIKAEVARCVYLVGTTKPAPKPAPPPLALTQPKTSSKPSGGRSGFFSSLFSSLTSGPDHSPSRPASVFYATPTPTPPPPVKEIDPLTILTSNVVLSIFSAEAAVKLQKQVIAELVRSTKKNPPSSVRIDLIYTGKVEYDASKEEESKLEKGFSSIFQGLRADIDGLGTARVFIGHATGQTTGIGGHLSGRFIPTVERESIDLVDHHVSVWNKELLYVGGFLARSAYEIEMLSIRDLWNGAAQTVTEGKDGIFLPDEQLQKWLRDRCIHALKFFAFHTSTPSAVVSNLLESGFFSCAAGTRGAKQSFLIMSTTGVCDISDVRFPDPVFAQFLKRLPVLPAEIIEEARVMLESLKARNMITDITFMDVLKELKERPLNETELIACMKWWISAAKQTQAGGLVRIRQEILNAAVLNTGVGTKDEKIIPLSTIRTYIHSQNMGDGAVIEGPLPDYTLSYAVSRQLKPEELEQAFGWEQLSLVAWLQHITSSAVISGQNPSPSYNAEYDITVNPAWAERVLVFVARLWPSLNLTQQNEVLAILKAKPCMPTRLGMNLPGQAYFPNTTLFSDLPIVTMPKGTVVKGNLEKLLTALGVRKHVELQLVFDRMIKTGDWTIADLAKYLASIRSNLASEEMKRLENTSVFQKEGPPVDSEQSGQSVPMQRYKASQLYEPQDVFRDLGLPIIDWGSKTKWRSASEEAKFLFELGLRRFPPLKELLLLAGSDDRTRGSKALRYFLDNSHRYYADYDPNQFGDWKFVPALTSTGESVLGTPLQVYEDEDSGILGYLVVDPTIREHAMDKLKLRKSPPTSAIIALLVKKAPQDPESAGKWFQVLAGRIADFSSRDLDTLSRTPMVPVKSIDSSPIQMRTPKECYFRGTSSQNVHSKLFVFVDFGSKANTFLAACGTKHEPSVDEIAKTLAENPRRFYELCEDRSSYLTELRNIAINRRAISTLTWMAMKKSAIVLGSRRTRKGNMPVSPSVGVATGPGDLDEEDWDLEWDLLKAEQVVVADDTNAYQTFGDVVFSAPQEDLLEDFYLALGSPRLTSLIQEEYRTTPEIKDSKLSREIRSLILERLPLFLYEHTHAPTRIQYSWLNAEGNFVVKTFGKLTTTKYLSFSAAKVRQARSLDASAIARRLQKRMGVGSAPVELWLAGNAQVDMYEVATSLCRLLFDTPKVNDALLFMTILSTDLRALKRRGYNVDRILKQQRAEREAAEHERRERAKEREKLLSDSQPQPQVPIQPPPFSHVPLSGAAGVDPHTGTSAPPPIPSQTKPTLAPGTDSQGRSQSPASVQSETETLTNTSLSGVNSNAGRGRPGSGFSNSFQNIRRMLGGANGGGSGSGLARGLGGTFGGGGGAGGLGTEREEVTPLSDINSNIQRAIMACREENQDMLQNSIGMRHVKESAEEGYCDVSGRVGDLQFIGSMGDVKVYTTHDLPNSTQILSTRHDSIARFIHIIQPLRQIYKLPVNSVHIFADSKGGTIAFNRNASLFLNLRYYEAWHDANVAKGDLEQAFISWFFVLAHEIAHNLVQPHNSEHEFWFSSLCEAHVADLGKLLASTSG